jgi:hypothetical protein
MFSNYVDLTWTGWIYWLLFATSSSSGVERQERLLNLISGQPYASRTADPDTTTSYALIS